MDKILKGYIEPCMVDRTAGKAGRSQGYSMVAVYASNYFFLKMSSASIVVVPNDFDCRIICFGP